MRASLLDRDRVVCYPHFTSKGSLLVDASRPRRACKKGRSRAEPIAPRRPIMSTKPRRRRDPAKEKHWRRIIRRHQTSGLSVHAFCEREGLKRATGLLDDTRRTMLGGGGRVRGYPVLKR